MKKITVRNNPNPTKCVILRFQSKSSPLLICGRRWAEM